MRCGTASVFLLHNSSHRPFLMLAANYMVLAMTPGFSAATVAVLRADSGRIRQMTDLRDLYLQAIEAYNAHDLDKFIDYYTDDCEGTTVIGEWTAEATNTGALYLPSGEVLPPTGKRFTNNGIDISVIDAGQIRSHRLYWDTAAVLAQLGLMPGSPQLTEPHSQA